MSSIPTVSVGLAVQHRPDRPNVEAVIWDVVATKVRKLCKYEAVTPMSNSAFDCTFDYHWWVLIQQQHSANFGLDLRGR